MSHLTFLLTFFLRFHVVVLGIGAKGFLSTLDNLYALVLVSPFISPHVPNRDSLYL